MPSAMRMTPNEQEEAQGEALHARVPVYDVADAAREREHHRHRDDHGGDHDGDVLRHPDRGDHGLEREHDVED